MRFNPVAFLLILLLSVLVVPSWGVVADGDKRTHPTLDQVKAEFKPTVVAPEKLRIMGVSYHALLKDGYVLAALQDRETGTITVVDSGVPGDAPLILLYGQRAVIAVYQVDQTKPLGDVADCMQAECVAPDGDGDDSQAEPPKDDANPHVPEPKPASMTAPQTVVDGVVAGEGLKLLPGYRVAGFARPDENGVVMVVIAAGTTDEELHNLRIVEGKNIQVAIVRTDGKPFADGEDPIDPACQKPADPSQAP